MLIHIPYSSYFSAKILQKFEITKGLTIFNLRHYIFKSGEESRGFFKLYKSFTDSFV